MKLKLTTAIKDLDGTDIQTDMTAQDVVDVLNRVIAWVSTHSKELGVEAERQANLEIDAKKSPLTIRHLLRIASKSSQPDLTDQERELLFSAAVRGHMPGEELELEAEHIVALKKVVRAAWNQPLVRQQYLNLLDGREPFATTKGTED